MSKLASESPPDGHHSHSTGSHSTCWQVQFSLCPAGVCKARTGRHAILSQPCVSLTLLTCREVLYSTETQTEPQQAVSPLPAQAPQVHRGTDTNLQPRPSTAGSVVNITIHSHPGPQAGAAASASPVAAPAVHLQLPQSFLASLAHMQPQQPAPLQPQSPSSSSSGGDGSPSHPGMQSPGCELRVTEHLDLTFATGRGSSCQLSHPASVTDSLAACVISELRSPQADPSPLSPPGQQAAPHQPAQAQTAALAEQGSGAGQDADVQTEQPEPTPLRSSSAQTHPSGQPQSGPHPATEPMHPSSAVLVQTTLQPLPVVQQSVSAHTAQQEAWSLSHSQPAARVPSAAGAAGPVADSLLADVLSELLQVRRAGLH